MYTWYTMFRFHRLRSWQAYVAAQWALKYELKLTDWRSIELIRRGITGMSDEYCRAQYMRLRYGPYWAVQPAQAISVNNCLVWS